MTKEQFFDWLSGYFDICEPDRIGVVETQTIKDHIDLVRSPGIIAQIRQSGKSNPSHDKLIESESIKKPAPPPPATLDDAFGATQSWTDDDFDESWGGELPKSGSKPTTYC